jgi:hypothetical protein
MDEVGRCNQKGARKIAEVAKLSIDGCFLPISGALRGPRRLVSDDPNLNPASISAN